MHFVCPEQEFVGGSCSLVGGLGHKGQEVKALVRSLAVDNLVYVHQIAELENCFDVGNVEFG